MTLLIIHITDNGSLQSIVSLSTISIMVTSNGIASPGPLTNVSGWEKFKEEMEFVVVKEEDDKTKLIALLYQGGSELRGIWKTVKPATAETTEIYKKSIALLDTFFLPTENLTFERSKFRAAVQREGKGFMDYITELKELRAGCELAILYRRLCCHRPTYRKML